MEDKLIEALVDYVPLWALWVMLFAIVALSQSDKIERIVRSVNSEHKNFVRLKRDTEMLKLRCEIAAIRKEHDLSDEEVEKLSTLYTASDRRRLLEELRLMPLYPKPHRSTSFREEIISQTSDIPESAETEELPEWPEEEESKPASYKWLARISHRSPASLADCAGYRHYRSFAVAID